MDANQNFLLRIINGFIFMLNQTVRLPRILVLLLDSDFTRLTAGYTCTEKVITCFVGNLVLAVGKLKSLARLSGQLNQSS